MRPFALPQTCRQHRIRSPDRGKLPTARTRSFGFARDPNNMPLSNQRQEGYENKIAELFAEGARLDAGIHVVPAAHGIHPNTLRAKGPNGDGYKCDLVIGWATGAEMAATTKPYLRSTFAMVYVKGKGLDAIASPDYLLKLPPGTARQTEARRLRTVLAYRLAGSATA